MTAVDCLFASRRRLVAAAAAVASGLPVFTKAGEDNIAPFVNYAKRDEVRLWAAEVSERRSIPFGWIIGVLTQGRTNDTTVKIMSRPALTASSTPRDWFRHRRNYVNASRVTDALTFIDDNSAAFSEAWKRFHIPPQIVAAVIGIETNYGRRMGNIRTLDALCTLSFDYTRRAAFFQSELESFLSLSWRAGADPTGIKGSFAGALGICQFMPSNIERFGIDLDGDGIVNLAQSPADAIGSAAHYLSKAGWTQNMPVSWPCKAPAAAVQFFDTGEPRLTTTLQNLLDAGVELPAPLHFPPSLKVLLVSLPTGTETIYRVGSPNFATLLDYNRSFFYAQSVADLADSILAGEVLEPDFLKNA